jgi:hypothetical protein
MYPEFDMPWEDHYMEHDEPPALKWWNQLYDGIEEHWLPDKDYVYEQVELDELGKMAPWRIAHHKPGCRYCRQPGAWS